MSHMMGFQLGPEHEPPGRAAAPHPEMIVSASLRVTGADLDPADVTRALEKPPYAAALRGGILREQGKHRIVAETGLWFGEIAAYSLPGGDLRLEGPAWSSFAAFLLKDVPAAEDLELSILLNGPEVIVMSYVADNVAQFASRMSAEAEHAEVDLDIPTAGLTIILGRGEQLDEDDLREKLGLARSPKP